MTNLVRGGVVLSLIVAFVAVIFASNQTETALSIADDSQSRLEIENVASEFTSDDKKLVKKTVSERPTAAPKTAAPAPAAAAGRSFTATAYCLQGRTAMGHGVRRGIIAADPRVLKLGSRVNLGAGSYSGSYLVSDTGGGIKGRRIDIWVPNCAEARRFGRRTILVQ
jgi:3D (Asp-Asp-Asp) domain-containing protein